MQEHHSDGMSGAAFNLCESADMTNAVPEAPAPQSWRESQNFLPSADIVDAESSDARHEMVDVDSFRYRSSVHKTRPTKRNPTSWTPIEDEVLIHSVRMYGTKNWAMVAEAMSQLNSRNGKQCRERWHNHLDPSLNHMPFTADEDRQLLLLRSVFDNKWTEISRRMPGRSDNAVKNRWNSTLFKVSPNLNDCRKILNEAAPPGVASLADDSLPNEHGNMQGTISTIATALPCAVRSHVSVRKSLPEVDMTTEAPNNVDNKDDVDTCFVDNCSNVAEFGFRAASGQVRRTRCIRHHEPGMYAHIKTRMLCAFVTVIC